jgi:hypothetical protein
MSDMLETFREVTPHNSRDADFNCKPRSEKKIKNQKIEKEKKEDKKRIVTIAVQPEPG